MDSIIKLDKYDQELIALLQVDARASYREMATTTGLSPAMVRRRIERLLSSGAVDNIEIPMWSRIGIQTCGSIPRRSVDCSISKRSSLMVKSSSCGAISSRSPTLQRRAFSSAPWAHRVPSLNGVARMAGRHHSRIVAGLPVCVTERPDAVRHRAATEYKAYGHLPSYRAILDQEGVAGPEDVALIGSASEVSAGLDAFAAAGATDFAAVIFATDRAERRATLELLENYGRQIRA